MMNYLHRTCVVFAAITLVANSALACRVPDTGPEFDAQIAVEVVDDARRRFRVIAPLYIDNRLAVWAYVHFYPGPSPTPGAASNPIRSDLIELANKGESVIGEFQIAEIPENSYAAVTVYFKGPCFVHATKIIGAIE